MPRSTVEERRAYGKAHYAANRDKVKEKCRLYRESNKDAVLARHKAWQKTAKGKFSFLRAGAKQRGIKVSLSFEEFSQLINNPCYYCGGKLPEVGSGVDRINSNLDYAINNARPCCTVCNLAKNLMSDLEFKDWINRVYTTWCHAKQ